MKLEAVDRKNPDLICVATVTNVIGNRFLVHFDEWEDTYDYWCEDTCPYIHPVGWCAENDKRLNPPNGLSPISLTSELVTQRSLVRVERNRCVTSSQRLGGRLSKSVICTRSFERVGMFITNVLRQLSKVQNYCLDVESGPYVRLSSGGCL